MQPGAEAAVLLHHQRVEVVGERRRSVLQQGRPGCELKRCEDDALVEALAAAVAQLQMMGATVAALGGQGCMELTAGIAVQLQSWATIDPQVQVAARFPPAVDLRPFQAEQSAGGAVRPAALQLLQPPVALRIEPLRTAAQFHRAIGCVKPGAQHAAAGARRQRLLQGALHGEATGHHQPVPFEVVSLEMRGCHREWPARSRSQQIFDHEPHLQGR